MKKRKNNYFWTEERLKSDYAVEYAHKLYKYGCTIEDVAELMNISSEYAETLIARELPDDYISQVDEKDEKYFAILGKLYQFKNMEDYKKGGIFVLFLLAIFLMGFVSHKYLAKILNHMKKNTGLFGFKFGKNGASVCVEGKNLFGKELKFAEGVVEYPELAEILATNMAKNPRGCRAFADAMADAGLHKQAEKLFRDLGMNVINF